MSEPYIEVTVVSGRWGEKVRRIGIPLSESLSREMAERVELSDDLDVLLLDGFRPGDSALESITRTVKHRAKVFRFRRETAHLVAMQIERALIDLMGENDTQNGYERALAAKEAK